LYAILLVVVALASSAPAARADSTAPTRYSIAGGCFTLTSAASGQAAPGAGGQRLQATRLGSYLLYGPAGDFLAVTGGNAVGRAAQPSPAADWQVEGAPGGSFTLSPASAPDRLLALSGGALVLVPRAGAGPETRFNFSSSQGCAVFPEAELNATGTPAKGETSYGEVKGVFDGHMHWMNFEYLGGNFHCGRPWSPYGIPSAMPDCSSIEGPMGAAAPMQNFLNYGQPAAPHSTAGWPQFTEWDPSNLTYEGNYYRWVERDWMAGMRLMAMPVNENRVLCELQANKVSNCDEMDTTRREIADAYALQDYVDAQAGGPGKGFFQIVRDPFQARKVINEGKMAVVLEVEISEPFGCRGYETSTCSKADVDNGLDELYKLGVRSSLLLNKFDNPLVGVRFDSGAISPLINAGNKDSSGSFWSAKTCSQPEHDNTIDGGPPVDPFIASQVAALGIAPGTVPTYPPAPHCNTRGLTELGRHMVRRMMDMGMIVNPDHMSQLGVDETISLAEARHYSGIISPHGWMDVRNWPRIYNLGGMAFPDSNDTNDFVNDWRKYRPANTPYYFGWAYGADLGGLAHQPEELPAGSPGRLTYPFKSLDGAVTLDRQRTGQRTFDYAAEGVDHYGLYADWLAEVAKVGGPQIASDMLRGPEAYLQMWERSEGVPTAACRGKGKFTKRGLGDIRLGLSSHELLTRVGQPLRRTRAWTYCVRGKRNTHAAATAVLTPQGSVAMIASSAKGNKAKGIGPGARVGRLKGHAKRIGHGVWVTRLRKKTKAAYVVRHRKVRLVAVARKPARNRAGIRRYLALVPPNTAALTRSRVPANDSVPVTPDNAVPLKLQQTAGDIAFACGLSFQKTFAGATPGAP
jgi:hypothetical protein